MELKEKQSKSEKRVVNELINLGLHPEEQYQIGTMHVDIAFPNVNLVVEINGPHHNEPAQHMTDIRRAFIIEKEGWIIKEYDLLVYKTAESIAKSIINDYEKLKAGKSIDWEPKSLFNLEKKLDKEWKSLLDLVDNSENPIFITGKAGTGKSTFLKLFVQRTEKHIVILAPTGLAAMNDSIEIINLNELY